MRLLPVGCTTDPFVSFATPVLRKNLRGPDTNFPMPEQPFHRADAPEPLAYVLGEVRFRRLVLAADRRAFIPRPGTEVLVDRCLRLLRGVAEPRVLDVGTGSGAIALAIAAEQPRARVTAVDVSADALALARENAVRTGLAGRVRFRRGHLLAGLAGPFDLVVSNPPYIASGVIPGLDEEVREHDPRLALDGGPDGLEPYRILLAEAERLLAPGGLLVVEIGYDQAEALSRLAGLHGLEILRIAHDLSNNPRCVAMKRL